MAPREADFDSIDTDTSLADIKPEIPHSLDDDMIPLNSNQTEPQQENDVMSSDSGDSSTIPQRPSLSKSRAKKARKATHKNQSSKPLLRPAKDILSRIRHDPALNEADYIVGYHDRHADVIEVDASEWKGGGDFTDEEWIPQHRILYFRRKDEGEGRRVWDRAARLDRLFGSGVVVAEDERRAVDVGSEYESGEGSEELAREPSSRIEDVTDVQAESESQSRSEEE